MTHHLASKPATRELKKKRAERIRFLAREIADVKKTIRGEYAGADPTNY